MGTEKYATLSYDFVVWLCRTILKEILMLKYETQYSFEFNDGLTYHIRFEEKSCNFSYTPRLRQEFKYLLRVLRSLPLPNPYNENGANKMSEEELEKGCKKLIRLIRLCHNKNKEHQIVIMDGLIADDEIPMFTLYFDQVDYRIIGEPLKREQLEVLYRVWAKIDSVKKNQMSNSKKH